MPPIPKIDPEGLDCEDLLSSWQWLLSDPMEPLCLSMFGDWFLKAGDGTVWFLDLLEGNITRIADTVDDFDRACQQADNLDQWFLAPIVLLCAERGLRPASGQCLAFKQPPVLGGPIDYDNVEVMDLSVWQHLMAQIHEQVGGLPEGTPIA